MYKKVLYLAAIIFFDVCAQLSRASLPAFADDEAPSADTTKVDTTDIDSRERELRRKEQELLQAMSFGQAASSQPAVKGATDSATGTGVVAPTEAETKRAVTVLEINAPEPSGASDISPQPIEAATDSSLHPEALRELVQHPALKSPHRSKSAPAVVNNRVRTKTYEDSPDGTTARRVGSFYKIERFDDDGDLMTSRGNSRTRTIPLSEIEPKSHVRRALLTSDEIATIRNSSTYLKTGPTRLDSTLLKIPQYSEVKIDYRSGTWYRVCTKSGVRGWVPGSALLFDAEVPTHSTVRIGAVN